MTGRHTICRWIRDRGRTTPGRVAIDYQGELVTYGELNERSDAFAAAFAEADLKRGDRVATLSGNSPDHVAVLFGCAKAGLTLLPLSWRLTAPELRFQLDDAEPALFLVEPGYDDLARRDGRAVRAPGRYPNGARPRPSRSRTAMVYS